MQNRRRIKRIVEDMVLRDVLKQVINRLSRLEYQQMKNNSKDAETEQFYCCQIGTSQSESVDFPDHHEEIMEEWRKTQGLDTTWSNIMKPSEPRDSNIVEVLEEVAITSPLLKDNTLEPLEYSSETDTESTDQNKRNRNQKIHRHQIYQTHQIGFFIFIRFKS
eukprot:TRINITY_DN18700_c0_g1_i1.p1 TRINITY_DN18700_c0_g1~~TRINITY_DN18700_c0_g1_i1.p1  ORF type:complete len:163 (-),score=28.83 TRINITY_DN18700_c0_g1_i1:24-512(-)